MELIDRKRLAKLMAIQGVSNRELARAAGWKAHSYMNRMVAGDPQAKTVKPESAARIAQYLGVGIDDLFIARVSSDVGRQSTPRGRTQMKRTA